MLGAEDEPGAKRMRLMEKLELERPPLDPVDREQVVTAAIAIMTDSGAMGEKYIEGNMLVKALCSDEEISGAVSRCKASLGDQSKKFFGKGWLKKLLEGEETAAQIFPNGNTMPCYQLVGYGVAPFSGVGEKVTPVLKGETAHPTHFVGADGEEKHFGNKKVKKKSGQASDSKGQTNKGGGMKGGGGGPASKASRGGGGQAGPPGMSAIEVNAFNAGWVAACGYWGLPMGKGGGGGKSGKGGKQGKAMDNPNAMFHKGGWQDDSGW